MKSFLPLIACAAAAAAMLFSGCAGIDDKSATEAKPAREFRTGSNIPVKDPAPPATPEERERTAEQIRALQRVGPTGKSGG